MSRYAVSIDWMTFVLNALPAEPEGEGDYLAAAIERTLSHAVGYHIAYELFSQLEPLGYGRAPYKLGFQDHKKGVTVWAGGVAPHMCVEFSGKGCAWLAEQGWLFRILENLYDTLSRFDVAIDLEGDTTPQTFVSAMTVERQKTGAKFNSPSGDTIYVGSVHSERYMRVYRYNAPHPRAHLLRIETVFRRSYAKQAGLKTIFGGLETVARASGVAFGYDHLIDWEEGVEIADLSVYRPERGMGKTLRWLITQVAPAFKKLVKDGTIPDPEKFLHAYFLDERAVEPEE